MINSKKKGFTIVELVIVIAVIAILSAVLIPTFSNLVKKANVSADQQAVRQMNTALAIYEAENGKPETLIEAKKALDEALVNVDGGLVPVSKGYAFYWDKKNNQVVLVSNTDNINENWEILTSNFFGKLENVSSETELLSALNLNNPVTISLTNDITLTNTSLVPTDLVAGKTRYVSKLISSQQVIEIDLNGNELTLANSADYGFLINGGHLVIKNGKIISNVSIQSLRNQGGTLLLSNVIIEDNSEQCSIYIKGISDTSIIGCTITSNTWYGITSNSSTNSNDGARISIIDTVINMIGTEENDKSGAGILINIIADITIDGCTINGQGKGMFLRGNNAIIKNSTFTCTSNTSDESYDSYDSFGTGAVGPNAAITLHAGGAYGEDQVFNYIFENVTAETIVAGTTENGKIIISGITPTRIVSKSNVILK